MIRSLATYVPPRILTNADFEKMVDTSDEWIRERTGIRERRIAHPEVQNSDMAAAAAKRALEAAGVAPSEVDLIIADRATLVPGEVFAGLPNLKVVMRSAIDIRNIDQAAASKAGVLVTHAEAGFVKSVVELTIGFLVDLSRAQYELLLELGPMLTAPGPVRRELQPLPHRHAHSPKLNARR